MEDALEDWLAVGLDGLSARTVTLYRGTIARALSEELGAVRLADLTAADVQKALTSMASRLSTRTVQIVHNVLVRAIRQAERDGLVGRNAAALVKPPKGQGPGRPSKSLTLEQAVTLMTAAQGTRLEAYHLVALTVSTEQDHHRRTGDATAHIAVNQERQAAGHLLSRVVAVGQQTVRTGLPGTVSKNWASSPRQCRRAKICTLLPRAITGVPADSARSQLL